MKAVILRVMVGVIGLVIAVTIPFQVVNAALVNINTAGSAELQTLTGIGPAKATAIIDYRNSFGLFQKIEDIMKVSGIGTATFESIKNFITVGSDVQAEDPGTDPDPDTGKPSSGPLSAHSSAQSIIVPAVVPLSLQVPAMRERLVSVDALVHFKVQAKGGDRGALYRYQWSFGDGGSATGSEVWYSYQFPGVYTVVVRVRSGDQEATARTMVEVVDPGIQILSVSGGTRPYIQLSNPSLKEVNLGGWSLRHGDHNFSFPADTIMPPNTTLNVPGLVSGISTDDSRSLYLAYPGGAWAAGWGDSGKPENYLVATGGSAVLGEERYAELMEISQGLALLNQQVGSAMRSRSPSVLAPAVVATPASPVATPPDATVATEAVNPQVVLPVVTTTVVNPPKPASWWRRWFGRN